MLEHHRPRNHADRLVPLIFTCCACVAFLLPTREPKVDAKAGEEGPERAGKTDGDRCRSGNYHPPGLFNRRREAGLGTVTSVAIPDTCWEEAIRSFR